MTPASHPSASALPEGADRGAEVLRVEDLVKHFPVAAGLLRRRGSAVQAVDGVTFSLATGETLGLVGESGCGKSTVARLIVRLLDPTAGRVLYRGRDIAACGRRQLRDVRRELQIVFQDPYGSLNPRRTVHEIVAQPLRVHGEYRGGEGRRRVDETLEKVGLRPGDGDRLPHEFSGGQRQRIGIARALVLGPRVLVLDEPVSALDVSIQAQVINLLRELQSELGLAYLLIAHDLAVVRHLCDRVAVMYLGRIVEIGASRAVYTRPLHPYTQALLSAVPVPDPAQRDRPRRIVLGGDVPDPANPPSGCRFRTRCWKAAERCAAQDPALVDRFGHGHPSACFFAEVPAAPTTVGLPP